MRLTIIGCSGSMSGPQSSASSYLVQADGVDTDGALRTTQALYLAQALLEGARAAGGLTGGEARALQRELVKVAGASAQAQVRQAGNGLALDLHWQGGGLAVQGQVGP